MNVVRTSPRSTSVGGSANGLPSSIVGDRLFPNSGGSFQAQRASVVSSEQRRATSALGVVMTPDMTLEQAIALASDQKSAGGRIFVSEGVWDFNAAGSSIAVSGLQIIALSPGKAYFRRAVTPTGSMLTVTGSSTRIEGITFIDTLGSKSAIDVQADNVSIERCVFSNVYLAIETSASISGLVVWDNRVDANRGFDWLLIGAACTLARIIGNTILAANKSLYAFSPGVINSSFVNNVHAPTGSISIAPNAGNVDAANVPEANADLAFTLTNNTASPTDVDASVLAWPVATYYGVTLNYSLYRGATPDITTGRIDLVMNSAECLAYADYQTTTVNPGVLFYGGVAAGVATLKYTTTATGNDATLKISEVQVRAY